MNIAKPFAEVRICNEEKPVVGDLETSEGRRRSVYKYTNAVVDVVLGPDHVPHTSACVTCIVESALFGRRRRRHVHASAPLLSPAYTEETPSSDSPDSDRSQYVADISAARLLRLPVGRQRTFRFFRPGALDFPGEPRAPPPYALGFWLGDGSARGPGYANAHELEVQRYHHVLAESYGLFLRHHGEYSYYLSKNPPKPTHRMPK